MKLTKAVLALFASSKHVNRLFQGFSYFHNVTYSPHSVDLTEFDTFLSYVMLTVSDFKVKYFTHSREKL